MKLGIEARERANGRDSDAPAWGLAAWLLEKMRGARRAEPRLALLERISLAPRQSLALIEAEGRRFLVATSAEGAPVFYPLDDEAKPACARRAPLRSVPDPVTRPQQEKAARISW
jgi:flagellar biogenesis protein FliO